MPTERGSEGRHFGRTRASGATWTAMDPARLMELLEKVKSGALDVATAVSELRTLPFADLGYARVDHHRALRQGVPEVVFAEGKSVDQIVGIVGEIARAGH